MKVLNRVVLPTTLSLVALVIVLALSTRSAGSDPATRPGGAPEPPPSSNGAISPEAMADSLHLVIAADREIYCRLFIARQTGGEPPSNALDGDKPGEPWPLPYEVFQRAAESIQTKGAEFSYALRSLHPIDPRNGPQTELERRGLDFIASHPAENFHGRETLGGRRYVTAVYPDLAAVAACVDCHNRRSASAPSRYQVGEVMGGIVVRVPLEF